MPDSTEFSVKRDPALHPLSQHHHFALIQAWEMRRAAEAPAVKRPALLRGAAQKFLRFWGKTGREHFREEEEILLPAYARCVRLDQDSDVIRMLADHAEIRAAVQTLEQLLAADDKAAARKLEELVASLAKTLHDHVRLEENVIFPRMEKTLGGAALRAAGKKLTRLHPENTCEI
jgi:iron-sulfur cluster repair protein YtfE (RIC family)